MSQPLKPLDRPVVERSTGKVRRASGDVAMLMISTAIVLWLTFSAWRGGAGDTLELSSKAIGAVIVGGFLNSALFSFFQAGEMRRLSNPSYVIPSWAPARVAVIMVLAGWACCLVSAFWLGLSWSRR